MKTLVFPVLLATGIGCQLMVPAPASEIPQSEVVDVVLGQGGVITGQVVDVQGSAVAEQSVVLLQSHREVVRATTDARGTFAIEGVQGGVYQLVVGHSDVVLRAWTAGTAPPVAQQGVLMVSGQDVYRGQKAVRSARNFLAHPVTVVGVVATGIAVPVALHHSRRKSPTSPD